MALPLPGVSFGEALGVAGNVVKGASISEACACALTGTMPKLPATAATSDKRAIVRMFLCGMGTSPSVLGARHLRAAPKSHRST
ncbi:hypothetical protein GCM10009631_20130 [Corynebacterium glaucum]